MAELLAYFSDPETEETENFIRIFDKFFDCLNSRSFSEWKTSRKPDLKPYTSPNDPRLEVIIIVLHIILLYFALLYYY